MLVQTNATTSNDKLNAERQYSVFLPHQSNSRFEVGVRCGKKPHRYTSGRLYAAPALFYWMHYQRMHYQRMYYQRMYYRQGADGR